MNHLNQNARVVQFTIHLIPSFKVFSYKFDNNKTFGDLKNDLKENLKIKKGTYHFEVNEEIMDDEIILADRGIINNSEINIVDNDCIKIRVQINGSRNQPQTIQKYMSGSNLKVIVPDENKEIKV